jgi:hypothetical protein
MAVTIKVNGTEHAVDVSEDQCHLRGDRCPA